MSRTEEKLKIINEIKNKVIYAIIHKRRVPYFKIAEVTFGGSVKVHFITPAALRMIEKDGSKAIPIFIDDYIWLVDLLLSTGYVTDIRYDDEDDTIIVILSRVG